MALDIEKRSLESYFGVIQRPQLPTEPIWPKKRLFSVLGFLVGLVLVGMRIFVKEVMAPNKRELMMMEAKRLETIYLGDFTHSPAVFKKRKNAPKLSQLGAQASIGPH